MLPRPREPILLRARARRKITTIPRVYSVHWNASWSDSLDCLHGDGIVDYQVKSLPLGKQQVSDGHVCQKEYVCAGAIQSHHMPIRSRSHPIFENLAPSSVEIPIDVDDESADVL